MTSVAASRASVVSGLADEVLSRGRRERYVRVPTVLGGAFRLVHAAAPRELRRAAALQVVGATAVALQLVAAKGLLDQAMRLGSDGSVRPLLPHLVAVAATQAVASFATAAAAEQQRLLQELASQHAMARVLRRGASVDLIDVEDPTHHDRTMRAQASASTRPAQMVAGALGLAGSLLSLAAVTVALLAIRPVFALVLVVFFPGWVLARRASRSSYEFTTAQVARDRMRSYLVALLLNHDNAKEVRAYQLADPLIARWDGLTSARVDDARGLAAERSRLALLSSLLTTGLLVLAVAGLLYLQASGRAGLAEVGAAFGGLLIAVQRLAALQSSVANLLESALFLHDYSAFVEPESASVSTAARPAPRPPAPSDPTRFELRQVGFRYPGATRPAIDGVDLRVAYGEVVALVGENGSGKTTLAKVLSGLLPPTAGRVLWDGIDVTGCDPASMRESTAALFQDFARFHLTLAENVELGRWTVAGDEVRLHAALERGGLAAVVDGLPDGVRSTLGPEFFGGSDLSGGQWQRIALARSIYRDASLIVLDEPTAALDPDAEAELFESMRTLYADKAVLLISHRMATVRTADRIYVLRDGRVAEEGTHAGLLELGGVYRRLFARQAAGYVG